MRSIRISGTFREGFQLNESLGSSDDDGESDFPGNEYFVDNLSRPKGILLMTSISFTTIRVEYRATLFYGSMHIAVVLS